MQVGMNGYVLNLALWILAMRGSQVCMDAWWDDPREIHEAFWKVSLRESYTMLIGELIQKGEMNFDTAWLLTQIILQFISGTQLTDFQKPK